MAATKRRTRATANKKTATKKAPAKKVSREPTAAQARALDRFAKEINVRLGKAEKMDDQATDHRLAAAIRLAEAKETCKEAHVPFKKWCEENVHWSYETARKLVRIGASDDPAGMLEDMRSKTAIQMRESRERAKAKQIAGPKAAAEPAKKVAPTKVVTEALASMPEEKAAKLIQQQAKKHGITVGAPQGESDELGTLSHAVAAFDALETVDKLHLMAHIAVDTGADISIFDQDIEDAANDAQEKLDAEKANSKAKPSRRRRAASRAAA